jgi:uncharacterized protein
MNGEALLDAGQLAVARRVIREESAKRDHVVVYLSGAHAYGFPSPDSDLDLKAIHVAPTEVFLGLAHPVATVDRAEVLDGIEIDYTSNEVKNALIGALRGNGNFLERVLGSAALFGTSWLDSLRPLVQRSLSRRVHAHYRGFAHGQLRELESEPTIKRLLYVLRTLLTGIHLLRTGRLVADLAELIDAYAVSDARDLIAAKRAGERSPLPAGAYAHWKDRVASLFELLDGCRERSTLPEEPANLDEMEAWLVDLRRGRLG